MLTFSLIDELWDAGMIMPNKQTNKFSLMRDLREKLMLLHRLSSFFFLDNSIERTWISFGKFRKYQPVEPDFWHYTDILLIARFGSKGSALYDFFFFFYLKQMNFKLIWIVNHPRKKNLATLKKI